MILDIGPSHFTNHCSHLSSYFALVYTELNVVGSTLTRTNIMYDPQIVCMFVKFLSIQAMFLMRELSKKEKKGRQSLLNRKNLN